MFRFKIENRCILKESYIYFQVNLDLNKNLECNISKLELLTRINKIGQTFDLKSRQMSYNSNTNVKIFYIEILNCTKDDLDFLENICTMMINSKNLLGVKQNAKKIFINEKILNYKKQCLIALNIFNNILKQIKTK